MVCATGLALGIHDGSGRTKEQAVLSAALRQPKALRTGAFGAWPKKLACPRPRCIAQGSTGSRRTGFISSNSATTSRSAAKLADIVGLYRDPRASGGAVRG